MSRLIAGTLLLFAIRAAASEPEAAAVVSSPHVSALIESAHQKKLADDRRWRALLHVRDGESEADAPAFFFAPNGKTDPGAELDATLRAFFSPVPEHRAPDAKPSELIAGLQTSIGTGPTADDAHPICKFPARFRFVAENLALDPAVLPRPACSEYEKWRGYVAGGTATMVFASSQVEVPASMFGHTFLRIDRAGAAPGSTLLSTIVNYAAVPTSANPFVYTYKGLTGGFPGNFSAMPYFVKVAEYTNHESRELWEYPLDLDPGELDWVLRHLWELDTIWFDYFFFAENCSYHLLSLLELAHPDVSMRTNFGVWTIPADTIRIARANGIAGEPKLRPSHLSMLRGRRDLLEPGEKEIVLALSDAETEPDWKPLLALPHARQALVLDTAFDHLKYRYGFFNGPATAPKVVARERRIIQERSTLRVPITVPGLPKRAPPDAGHLSGRLTLGVKASGDPGNPRVVQELQLRPALHDWLDPPDGYSDATLLEMFSVRVRIDPDAAGRRDGGAEVVTLERLDITRVDSLRPWEEWVHGPSWGLGFGAGRVVDAGCDGWRCTAADGMANYGIALGNRNAMTYVRAAVLPSLGGPYAPAWRITGDVNAGVLAQVGRHSRLHLEGAMRYDAWGGTPAKREPYPVITFGQAFDIGSNAQLRVNVSRVRDTREAMISAATYF